MLGFHNGAEHAVHDDTRKTSDEAKQPTPGRVAPERGYTRDIA